MGQPTTEQKRRYTTSDKGRIVQQRAQAKYISANPEKIRARRSVQTAISNGTLVRPNICEHCSKSVFTEASHDDYSKRLDVEWLCRSCHRAKDPGLN